MNKLYLHVGPHKTGSTSIQKFLVDNRGLLFESNLVYPKRLTSIFGHHPLRDLIDSKSLSAEDLAFFNQEKNNFLVSSEDFISLGKDKFEYLKQSFESKDIKVIFTWRRASFKLYSIWQETIKHGGTHTFHEYYHQHLARPAQSQMLSADLKLNMFCQVFGKQNVRVIDYEASDKQDSLLQDFIRTVDVKWDEKFVTPESNANATNRSMDLADVEVIRALNHIFKHRYNVQGAWVRHQYQDSIELLQQTGLDSLKDVISNYKYQLKVGNYFIDNRCERVMADNFGDNIVNYEANSDVNTLEVVYSEWMFEIKAQSILGDLTKILMRKLDL